MLRPSEAREIQTCKSFLPDLDRFKFVTLDLSLDADSPGHLHSSPLLSSVSHSSQICFYRSLVIFLAMRQNPSLAIIFPALCGNNFSFFARNTKFTIKAFFVNDFFLDSSAFVMSVRGIKLAGIHLCSVIRGTVCDVWRMMDGGGVSNVTTLCGPALAPVLWS